MSEFDGYVAKLEAIRRVAPDGSDYWMARDIQPLLGYSTWENFETAMGRAREACASSGVEVIHQFRDTTKMMEMGKGARRQVVDWFLSRYACYLIALNGDTTKREVGYAQTYFTVQTRRQEMQDQLTEVERRAFERERLTLAHNDLMKAAQGAGVVKFAVFQHAGTTGLYGGLGVAEVQIRKNIPADEVLFDCAGPEELAMNMFQKTQAEAKLKRDRVNTQERAIQTNHAVGCEVRAAVERMGGTMPEDLPAEPNLKKMLTPKQRLRIRELAVDERKTRLLGQGSD